MRVWHGLNIFSRMPNVLRVREKKTEKRPKTKYAHKAKEYLLGKINIYIHLISH